MDVALWDIAGKAAGLPVHRLLGTVRDRIPAYTSSWCIEGQVRWLRPAPIFAGEGESVVDDKE